MTGLLVAPNSTVEQAEELSLHFKKRGQVNPVLQWSQIAKPLHLGKVVEGGFENLAWVV